MSCYIVKKREKKSRIFRHVSRWLPREEWSRLFNGLIHLKASDSRGGRRSRFTKLTVTSQEIVSSFMWFIGETNERHHTQCHCNFWKRLVKLPRQRRIQFWFCDFWYRPFSDTMGSNTVTLARTYWRISSVVLRNFEGREPYSPICLSQSDCILLVI